MSATPAGDIRLTGQLGRDAQARYTPQGQAWLFLEIENGQDGVSVEARRCVGEGPAAQMVAARTAHRLRRGSRVTVYAQSYRIAHDAAGAHLLLGDVTHIEHQAVVAYHEQARL